MAKNQKKITRSRVTAKFKISDILGSSLFKKYSKADTPTKKAIRELIGEELVDGINETLDSSVSPAVGGSYKKKLKDGSPAILADDGDLRASIEYEPNSQSIEVGVFDGDERDKAYGHQTGFKGHPFLDNKGLRRQILPEQGQRIRDQIIKLIREEVRDELGGQDN